MCVLPYTVLLYILYRKTNDVAHMLNWNIIGLKTNAVRFCLVFMFACCEHVNLFVCVREREREFSALLCLWFLLFFCCWFVSTLYAISFCSLSFFLWFCSAFPVFITVFRKTLLLNSTKFLLNFATLICVLRFLFIISFPLQFVLQYIIVWWIRDWRRRTSFSTLLI